MCRGQQKTSKYIKYSTHPHPKTKIESDELYVRLNSESTKQKDYWLDLDPDPFNCILVSASEHHQHTTTFTSNLNSRINAARNLEEITIVIESLGLAAIADRITYLHKIAKDDPDEMDFDLESLRRLALFFTDRPQLPTPQIVIDEDGFSHATWRIPDRGILILVFLPSDMIKFVGIFQPPEPNSPQWNVRGTLPPTQILKAMSPFLDLQPTN